ncbi:MAG: MopE-related protein [Polyangiales bacterium]
MKLPQVSWVRLLVALAWIATAPGCADRRAEGGSCVFNDDCSDPLICAGAFCRAQCRTDRDCPGGWICHNAGVPGKQVCLPPPAPVLCATDEHCLAGATCTSAHECRWRCARDPDCLAHRPSLSCTSASVCNAPILVVELLLASGGDAGPLDAPPDDASIDAPPSDVTPDAPAIDIATPDVIDAPAIDIATPDVVDAPAIDTAAPDVVDAPAIDTAAPDVVDATPVDAVAPDAPPRCGRDFQCDDGVFCNGAERCNPSDPAADARGCAPPDGPRCMTGQRCDERMGRCLTMCELDGDADDDGYNAAMCGGPDCDDARASIHPGAPELCNGVDDDCDRMVDEEGAALCALRFGTPACREGACAVASCTPGHGDCDLVASNGCETELAANPINCGACGRLCALTANATAMVCRASACAVATCQDGTADCDGAAANGCELDVSADINNCGRCGSRCTARPFATARCVGGACALSCAAGRADCDGDALNGCEVDLASDRANCGRCGNRCAVASDACVAGSCLAQPFASSGAEGAFAPMQAADAGAGPTLVTLPAGVHHFTSVTIPAGVTVVTDGDGVLEIRATGDVVIDGTIDLSGANGAAGFRHGRLRFERRRRRHGATQRRRDGRRAERLRGRWRRRRGLARDEPAGRRGRVRSWGRVRRGRGRRGLLRRWWRRGVAGGGGGSNGGNNGGAGASVATYGTGGAGGAGGHGGGFGGEAGVVAVPTVYRGFDGIAGNGCNTSGSGGGGSIGARAAADLAVTDPATFRAGSGGGGGAGGYSNCIGPGAGGGGGGGGALRIASATRIVVRGSVFARGGAGGAVAANGGGTSGAGGGGSGGLIYLSAPALDVVSGTLSVAGGSGSQPLGCVDANGGRGGLGRLRLSVLPSRCNVTGTWTPPLPAGGCVATTTSTPGQVYIGVYPD